MYPGAHASTTPDKAAVVMADTGEEVSYAQLEESSTRLANVLRGAGLRRGDVVALLSTNSVRMFEVYWACLRSGFYLTPVNSHLSADEVSYIVGDCDARALVVSADLAGLASPVAAALPGLTVTLAYDGAVEGFGDYAEALAAASPVPPQQQPRGGDMLYSSGTTGRPKGVKPTLPEREVHEPGDPYVAVFGPSYGFSDESVYYSPAPLYHAAPLRFGMVVQSLGGTVVTSRRFDPMQSLEILGKYSVTHSQWVPTHFVRMLRLPEDVRATADVSSLTHAIHAAAPCSVEVKRAMIEWWGPILFEYYSSTEANGITMIGPKEWLAKPGSVGKAKLGTIRVCAADGHEVPIGEVGLVYFERDARPFSYHRDEGKTAEATHPAHPAWTTTGDIGRIDADGYLFLTDRKSFTIISGGVNIYPQEIEDALALHPDVDDVAVVGIPDEEMGESVLAVIKPRPGTTAGDATRERILLDLRTRLAGYKLPRRIEFVDELPRTPTGKLVKRQIQAAFTPAVSR